MEQTIELTFPVCPQEEEQENLEIVLDRPVGGARLAVSALLKLPCLICVQDGYQKLDLTIENDIRESLSDKSVKSPNLSFVCNLTITNTLIIS